MSTPTESAQSAGSRITVLELRNFFLDNLDKFVLAACKNIEDDGSVVLNEGFDTTKAMATQFHVCLRCNAEEAVAHAGDASIPPRSGHSSAPYSAPATNRDESDNLLPGRGEVPGKKTTAGKVSSSSWMPLMNVQKVANTTAGSSRRSL